MTSSGFKEKRLNKKNKKLCARRRRCFFPPSSSFLSFYSFNYVFNLPKKDAKCDDSAANVANKREKKQTEIIHFKHIFFFALLFHSVFAHSRFENTKTLFVYALRRPFFTLFLLFHFK